MGLSGLRGTDTVRGDINYVPIKMLCPERYSNAGCSVVVVLIRLDSSFNDSILYLKIVIS